MYCHSLGVLSLALPVKFSWNYVFNKNPEDLEASNYYLTNPSFSLVSPVIRPSLWCKSFIKILKYIFKAHQVFLLILILLIFGFKYLSEFNGYLLAHFLKDVLKTC